MHSDKCIFTFDKTTISNRIGKVKIEIRLVQKFEHFFQLTTTGCSKEGVSFTTLSELLKINIKILLNSLYTSIYLHVVYDKDVIHYSLGV